jgi:hypothetical protein
VDAQTEIGRATSTSTSRNSPPRHQSIIARSAGVIRAASTMNSAAMISVAQVLLELEDVPHVDASLVGEDDAHHRCREQARLGLAAFDTL